MTFAAGFAEGRGFVYDVGPSPRSRSTEPIILPIPPIPDPGPRRRRDLAGSRRGPPAQDDRGDLPGARSRDAARSSARAGGIDGPCRSPRCWGSMRRWSATRGPWSRTPPGIGRSGGPTWPGRAGRRPRVFRAERRAGPLVHGSGPPRIATSWSGPHPSGRPLFDDYLDLNESHAEVDPDWVERPGGATTISARSGPGRR